MNALLVAQVPHGFEGRDGQALLVSDLGLASEIQIAACLRAAQFKEKWEDARLNAIAVSRGVIQESTLIESNRRVPETLLLMNIDIEHLEEQTRTAITRKLVAHLDDLKELVRGGSFERKGHLSLSPTLVGWLIADDLQSLPSPASNSPSYNLAKRTKFATINKTFLGSIAFLLLAISTLGWLRFHDSEKPHKRREVSSGSADANRIAGSKGQQSMDHSPRGEPQPKIESKPTPVKDQRQSIPALLASITRLDDQSQFDELKNAARRCIAENASHSDWKQLMDRVAECVKRRMENDGSDFISRIRSPANAQQSQELLKKYADSLRSRVYEVDSKPFRDDPNHKISYDRCIDYSISAYYKTVIDVVKMSIIGTRELLALSCAEIQSLSEKPLWELEREKEVRDSVIKVLTTDISDRIKQNLKLRFLFPRNVARKQNLYINVSALSANGSSKFAVAKEIELNEDVLKIDQTFDIPLCSLCSNRLSITLIFEQSDRFFPNDNDDSHTYNTVISGNDLLAMALPKLEFRGTWPPQENTSFLTGEYSIFTGGNQEFVNSSRDFIKKLDNLTIELQKYGKQSTAGGEK